MSFLYDQYGKRKYLTIRERNAFLLAAKEFGPDIHAFCATLAYTGARISEVLCLVPEQIEENEKVIVIECLKKRRKGVHRAVPVPGDLIRQICMLTSLRGRQDTENLKKRIWPWCRTTGWKHVKAALAIAGIQGANASPKALRHSFAISAIQAGLPLNLVGKWLGHSRLSTTAIYADAIGPEEQEIATKFWKTFL